MTPELAEEIKETLESTKNFVLEQAPDVVQEVIMMGRIQSIGFVLMCIALVVACIVLSRKALKFDYHYSHNLTPKELGSVCGAAITGVLALVLIPAMIFNPVEVWGPWFTPKLYILHVISGLLT